MPASAAFPCGPSGRPNPHPAHRPRPRPARAAAGVAAVLAALLLGACSSVPDAGKLASASTQLHSAIGASGSAVSAELRAAQRSADDAAEAEARGKQIDAFGAAWAQTERSSAALVQYAEALSGLVAAGKEGGDTVQRLAGAGAELASAVGLPAAGATGAAVDLSAYVYQQIALARAAKSLEESLARMQPAVDRIAGLIVRQLGDAGVILVAANRIEAVNLRARFSADTGYRRALQDERRTLYSDTRLAPATAQRLAQIDQAERIVQARLDPMEQQLAASNQRLRQSAQLIAAAQQAVADWALAHRQLLVAVRESRAVDPVALLASIEELRVLVRKVREAS